MDHNTIVALVSRANPNNIDPSTYQQAVEAVLHWQYDYNNSFNDIILDAIAKADMFNSAKLERAFPELCTAYAEWYVASNDKLFFKKYGLNIAR